MANGFGSFGGGVASGMAPWTQQMMYAQALRNSSLTNPATGAPYAANAPQPGWLARQFGAQGGATAATPAQPQPVVPAGTQNVVMPGSPGYPSAAPRATAPLMPWETGPLPTAPAQAGGMFPQPVPYASTLPGGTNALPVRPAVRRVAPPLTGPAQGYTMQHFGQERGYLPPTNWPMPQSGTPYFPPTGAVGTGF